MKTNIKLVLMAGVFSSLVFLTSGCYTQLRTVRSSDEGDEGYADTEQAQDSSYNSENQEAYTEHDGCCDDYYRPRVGFSYYYPSTFWPSTAFGVAYANPWYYDYYWAYDPYYYYNPYYYGYNSYWYAPYYYSPWYYGYYYTSGGSNIMHGRRYDGSMRGNDRNSSTSATGYNPTTTGGARYDLPSGTSLGRTSGAPPSSGRNTPSVRDNTRRQSGNDRGYTRRDSRTTDRNISPGNRGSSSRDSNRGTERRREVQPQYRPQETPNHQPTYQPPHREPSYSPPQSQPPRQSSPPPSSSGGSKRDDSSNRGGGNSGGRRP